MTTATPDKANASSTRGKIVKSPWHESVPDQPGKLVEATWKEQFALISALSEEAPAEESIEEGTPAPNPGNGFLIEKVKQMKKDNSLEKALDHLAAAHDAKKPTDPSIIVQVAQLLCIMDESVYLRDLEVEKKVQEDMKKYGKRIESAMEKNEKLSDKVKNAIGEVFEKMDGITNQINAVAAEMGLEYVPLCNFSSHGKILINGPYCGAFYRKPQNGDNGFIVVAFKGTGRGSEWFTDARICKVSARNSPVRGKCHEGFFSGMFSEFPSEISVDAKVGKTIPFDLLKKQLWRLTAQTMENTPEQPVSVWITGHSLGGAYAAHCWQGLLATARLNPYDANRTIRDLFTFGSPRVGDKEYARYPSAIKAFQNSWRFVNQGDIVAKVPYVGYHHVDRKVVISPQKIELRDNKHDDSEGAVGEVLGHLLGITQHGLGSYWESLRGGAKKVRPGSWPESQREVTPPPHPNLATWSLEDYHPPKHVPSESHADSVPPEESVLIGKDRRRLAEPEDFQDGCKYRSVVKVQSMFRARPGSTPIWTMGTGWLIREDLVVTAGHNVYSKNYGGQAERIKCWIGYKGRKFVNDPDVQHRKALNIVTTTSWSSNKSDRRRDVALIQVSAPFEGEVKPFQFSNTDTKITEQKMTVVGYPGDKSIEDQNGDSDPGAEMWFHTESISYDLEATEGMIKYDIDTFGGQSGAPILLRTTTGLQGIGTHCYGAGGLNHLNSGNAIGGADGNDYTKFIECLSGSAPENPTPIGTFLPNKSGNSGSDPDDEESFPGGEESFWSVFKTVAKIGSVALPSAGAFLGPAGILLGTVAGGVLGSLAESAIQSDSPKIPDDEVQESCIQRAQLAEAVLQCVFRLGQSSQSNKVLTKMEEIWGQSYSQQIPHLVDFIGPVLTEYGFFITANNWEKEVQPNPEERKVLEGEDDKFSLDPPENIGDTNKAKFVHALFEGDTKRVEGIPADEESFTAWFKPLIEKAILVAKPLATQAAKSALNAIIDRITKSSPESFAPGDKQRKSFEHIIRRALMADCALQAVETLDEKERQELKLSPTDAGHEEGIIDSIKTRVQKIGPVALKYAKRTVRKYLPVLLKQLAKTLDAKESNVDFPVIESIDLAAAESIDLTDTDSVGITSHQFADLAPLNLRTIPVSAVNPRHTISRYYRDDDNADAPPVEPRPPVSPKE